MDAVEGRVLIDREVAAPWVEVAQSARMCTLILSRVQEPTEGSVFAQVDEMYPSQAASRWVRAYLQAALEHLTMWADFAAPLTFSEDHVVVHSLRPAQALARAAAESAAQAVWVMAAGAPQPCARRHLTLVLHDLKERANASEPKERERIFALRTAAIADLADVTSVGELLRPPAYMTLIRDASSEVIAKGSISGFPSTTDGAERVWRASAGAMHGKRWPSLRQMVDLPDENGRLVRVPDPEAISKALKLADGLTAYGIFRFADYCGHSSELEEILRVSLVELAVKLPLLESDSVDSLLNSLRGTNPAQP